MALAVVAIANCDRTCFNQFPLTPKQRIGPFEIVSLLGRGGMGEVFLATDTRLDRKIAIKVLPAEFASDQERLRRFEQEAKTLATLSHPNVLSIFEVGVNDGAPYLVSELLEGQTLREVLKSGALPQRKAIEYASQIAQGLAAAHAKGIIHRDLKPENIFVTKDGRVKILDFGLAKLRASSQSPVLRSSPTAEGGQIANQKPQIGQNASAFTEAPADMPTLLQTTDPGLVLGTAGYMSPEQLCGEEIDHRTDIFAVGAIAYEMLCGKPAFRRESRSATMTALLKEESPRIRDSNRELSWALEEVVQHCLAKSREGRFSSAHDLALALKIALTSLERIAAPIESQTSSAKTNSKQLIATTGFVLAAVLVGFGVGKFGRNESTAPIGFRFVTYSGNDWSPAASPDGKWIAFTSDRNGMDQIWQKDIASGSEVPITHNGSDDFARYSRDGTKLLFIRSEGNGKSLYVIPSIGGEARKIVDNSLSADWSPDGMQIVFVRWSGGTNRVSGIHLVGADGAGERELIRLQGQRVMHPRWSLDGEKIAASINERGMPQRIVLVSVADGGIRLLDPPSYRPPISSVVFARDNNSLVYLQADSVTATLGSSPAQLIRQNTRTGRWKSVLLTQTHGNMVDLLPDGRVLLDARSPRANLREVALEQPSPAAAAGKSLTVGNSADRQPVYSPDGELIAFSSNRGGNLDIWTLSRKTGIVRRLTDHPAEDWDPAFSPDGKRLLWSSNRSGKFQIWMANVDGTAPRQVTHNDHDSENPAMSAHGGWIVYVLRTSGIWKVRPDGTDAKQLTSSGWLWIPEISPDGKYVAYFEEPEPMLRVIRAVEVESGELVPFEIRLHIQKPTPALIGRLRWMPDGTKIVFLGQDDRGLNGVFVQDFTPGMDTTATRRPLAGFESDSSAESFAISPDGLRLTIASWERNSSIGVAETVP